MATFDFLMN